jgi:hypothetical protein
MLEAIADPKHERHAELTEWIGDDFDPHGDQAKWLTAEVDALARKWSRESAPAALDPRPFAPAEGDCALPGNFL